MDEKYTTRGYTFVLLYKSSFLMFRDSLPGVILKIDVDLPVTLHERDHASPSL